MNSSRLTSLFQAKSMAIVGATERSAFFNHAYLNCKKLKFENRVRLVNPKGGTICGRTTARSCTELGEPVDIALMMVPVAALFDSLEDVAAAGIHNAVILSSGFREVGAEGEELQNELLALTRRLGITFLGPNCLGFVNYVDKVPVYTGFAKEIEPNPIAVVSQSGAVASHIHDLAERRGIGMSYQIATGNEADVTSAEVIDFLLDDPRVKVVTAFLESTRDTDVLRAAAAKARERKKAIVVLKVGSGEQTARAAEAHTGSIVGNDDLYSAACAQFGIIRVRSIEEMIATAELAMRMPPPNKPQLGIVSMSGGVCEIASDRADEVCAPLLPFNEATIATLSESTASFGTVHNPLDLTGAAVNDPERFTNALITVAGDPDVGAVIAVFDPPRGEGIFYKASKAIAAAAKASKTPIVQMSVSSLTITTEQQQIMNEMDLTFTGSGINEGIGAMANMFRWSKRLNADVILPMSETPTALGRPASEHETLALLHSHGVPTVPQKLVTSVEEALAAADCMGGSVALKIASGAITHKTELGSALLSIEGADAVTEGFNLLMERAVATVGMERVEGVLVSPMRTDGIELIVGISHDPSWGLNIAVRLGGICGELLRDAVLRVLPVSEEDVLEMLTELRAARFLNGYRGGPAVDRNALARAICAIGNAAYELGSDLDALEINPLWVHGSQVEVLDALAVWGKDET